MKMEYTDENTFITEKVEILDEIYEIADNLHKEYRPPHKSDLCSKSTPIMVGKDKKSLVFCINLGDKQKDKVAYDKGDNLYRIRIEKI